MTAAEILVAIALHLPTAYAKDPDRMATVAVAAEDVASEVQFRKGRRALVGAVLTAVRKESAGWRSVHIGERLGPVGEACLVQIHPRNPVWRRMGLDNHLDLTGIDYASTRRCLLAGALTLKSAAEYCHRKSFFKFWDVAMWAIYARGSKCWPPAKQSRERARMAAAIAGGYYTPTEEQLWRVETARERARVEPRQSAQ